MPMFQKSVLNKYLKEQDKKVVHSAYEIYYSYFQNSDFNLTTEFIKELNKAIKKAGGKKLSKMDEMDWMEVFETKKAEAQTLKAEIDKTDRQIDRMVYQL